MHGLSLCIRGTHAGILELIGLAVQIKYYATSGILPLVGEAKTFACRYVVNKRDGSRLRCTCRARLERLLDRLIINVANLGDVLLSDKDVTAFAIRVPAVVGMESHRGASTGVCDGFPVKVNAHTISNRDSGIENHIIGKRDSLTARSILDSTKDGVVGTVDCSLGRANLVGSSLSGGGGHVDIFTFDIFLLRLIDYRLREVATCNCNEPTNGSRIGIGAANDAAIASGDEHTACDFRCATRC